MLRGVSVSPSPLGSGCFWVQVRGQMSMGEFTHFRHKMINCLIPILPLIASINKSITFPWLGRVRFLWLGFFWRTLQCPFKYPRPLGGLFTFGFLNHLSSFLPSLPALSSVPACRKPDKAIVLCFSIDEFIMVVLIVSD